MIRSFRHKGLAGFFSAGVRSGVKPEHAARLSLILATLNVSGNWRVTFSFMGKDAVDVDYEDYH